MQQHSAALQRSAAGSTIRVRALSAKDAFAECACTPGSRTRGSRTRGSRTRGSHTRGNRTRVSRTRGSHTRGSCTRGLLCVAPLRVCCARLFWKGTLSCRFSGTNASHGCTVERRTRLVLLHAGRQCGTPLTMHRHELDKRFQAAAVVHDRLELHQLRTVATCHVASRVASAVHSRCRLRRLRAQHRARVACRTLRAVSRVLHAADRMLSVASPC